MNELPNYTEYTDLFDEYRINYIVMKFLPITRGTQVSLAGMSSVLNPVNNFGWYQPQIHICPDYNDADTPSSIASLQQKHGYRVTEFNKPVILKFRPAVSPMIYRSAATTAYGTKWKQWLHQQYTDTPHYGAKWIITGLNESHAFTYQVQLTYYMSFRYPR